VADCSISNSPLIKPDVRFSRIRLSNHLLPEAFAFAWPSSIASTGVLETLGVYSVTAISTPSLLQKHDEGIAPFLSQGYVVLEIQAVLWATPTPLSTWWNFVSLYPPVAASAASARASRVHCRMAAPTCHPCYPGSPSIGSGSFRQDRCNGLSLCRRGSTAPLQFSRLHLGSLALRPAGLLDSLTEPLSGNLMLQVTLNTSLQLHGWTTELPSSDFNRQVIRFTRHTLQRNNCQV